MNAHSTAVLFCCLVLLVAGVLGHRKVKSIHLAVKNDSFWQLSFNTSLTKRCPNFGEDAVIHLDMRSCDSNAAKTYSLHPCETEVCPSLPVFGKTTCLFLAQGNVTSNTVELPPSSYPNGNFTEITAFIPILGDSWRLGSNETSYIFMKKKKWAAHSLMRLEHKPRENNSESDLQCIPSETFIEGTSSSDRVTFTHRWNEDNRHCVYRAAVRFQDLCRNNLTRFYELEYPLRLPAELRGSFVQLQLETEQKTSKWVITVVIILFASTFAVLVLVVIIWKCFQHRSRVEEISLTDVQTTSGCTEVTITNTPERKGTPLKLLLVYARDTKERVTEFSTLLEEKSGCEVLDLYDVRDVEKLNDPSMWLNRLLLDSSTVTILVASREIHRERGLGYSSESKEVSPSHSSEPIVSSSPKLRSETPALHRTQAAVEYHDEPHCEKDSHEELGSTDHDVPIKKDPVKMLTCFEYLTSIPPKKQEAHGRHTRSFSGHPCDVKPIAFKKASSMLNISRVILNPSASEETESTGATVAIPPKREKEGPAHDALHFLLREFFNNMISLQLSYDYRRVYQVRFSDSPTDAVLDDITPGRLYLLPDQMDFLIKDITNSRDTS